MKLEIDDNTEIIKEIREHLRNIDARLTNLEMFVDRLIRSENDRPKTRSIDVEPDFNRVNVAGEDLRKSP